MIHEPGKIVYSMYEIVGLVGQGGMGAVYKARDLRDMGIVALKQMREDTTAGFDAAKMREKFEQEWQILRTLTHPRIPRMLNAFHEEDSIYYVMEFIEGKSLATKVRELKKQGKRFPEILLLEYTKQILDVLEYLHGRPVPVLHRDIKPENVIVRDSNGEIVLVDFGLARNFGASAGQATQTQVGTLGFAPLEQVKGKPEIRSDLYGVGATMWYMLAAEVPQPFDIQPIEELRNDLFPGIAEIVNRACQSQPNRRYSSAARMELAVRQALANLQGIPLDVRTEQLFVEEAPIQAQVVVDQPMSAGLFLRLAMVGVVVVLGGIFMVGSLRSQLTKPGQTPTPGFQSPSSFAATPFRIETRPGPGPAQSNYRILPNAAQVMSAHRAKPAPPDLKEAYRGWVGQGWELVGVVGQVQPGGQLVAEVGQPAALLFYRRTPVQLTGLVCQVVRVGGNPASMRLVLGTGQATVSLASDFQDGGYQQAVNAGDGAAQGFLVPRKPFEDFMSLALRVSGPALTLAVDGSDRGPVEVQASLAPIDSIQIIIPPANSRQHLSLNSLSVSGL